MVNQLFVVVGSILASFAAGSQWDYKHDGPNTWHEKYPECAKEFQSPIDIISDDAVIDDSLCGVNRTVFSDTPKAMTISNNGHSLVVSYDGQEFEIDEEWKVLPFQARMAQYHLHWANNSQDFGSEHTVNGKPYFGELHAVYYNTKYSNFAEAKDKDDGLAVFGWFIEVASDTKNPSFDVFLDIASQGALTKGESVVVAEPFSLETLLPINLHTYYRYNGSLTTPPCYQSVSWTVFEDTIKICKDQADILANSFFDAKDEVLNKNYRPAQLLNERIVTKSPAVPSGSQCL